MRVGCAVWTFLVQHGSREAANPEPNFFDRKPDEASSLAAVSLASIMSAVIRHAVNDKIDVC
jgi:hypothetical protein